MLIEATIELLGSNAGSLAYHTILAFSIAFALQLAIGQNAPIRSDSRRRLVFGLALLLSFQIVLFIFSGLIWQQNIQTSSWLGLLDRSIALLSLVVLVWLWGFPQKNSAADAGTLVALFITVIGCIFAAVWWSRSMILPGAPLSSLNGSAVDIAFQAVSLIICAVGLVLLAAIRPQAWPFGIAMFSLLGCGHLFQLLLPFSGTFPVILRFFEIAAYPFLLVLPQRSVFHISAPPLESAQQPKDQPIQQDSAAAERTPDQSIDPIILKALLAFIDMPGDSQACQRVVSILASAAHAEQAFLVSPPNLQGLIHIECGYDQAAHRYVDEAWIDGRELPILTSCLKMGRIRRLSAASSSPDRLNLAVRYNLENMGAMLFVPVISSEGRPLNGAILIANDPQVDWTNDEQIAIGLLARFVISLLHLTEQSVVLRQDLVKAQQASRHVQDHTQQMIEDDQRLRDQYAALQEFSERDQHQIARMAAILAEQSALQKAALEIRDENRQLTEAVDRAERAAASSQQPLMGELRMALEELSLLRLSTSAAEERLSQLGAHPISLSASSAQIQEIFQICEEMRQPLASVGGNTDMLLGESLGILGKKQRKLVERIKLSTERLSRLIDDLTRLTLAESDASRLQHKRFDLLDTIEKVRVENNALFQLRGILLKQEVPVSPLFIESDPDAIESVLVILLRNAASVTPENGEVTLSARLESSESRIGRGAVLSGEANRDFLLIQVSDHGGGIPLNDRSKVFSLDPAVQKMPGIGVLNAELMRMQTIVETLGGRTWLDSEEGVGSVFTVLLPVQTLEDDEGIP